MCYCSKGLDLLRRTLCLFLCVVLLLCFFLVPRAHAVVAEAELAYWGGAIVVSVLAAGGMALATGDAQKVGSAMYAALKDTGGKAWDSIQAMAAWAAAAGSKAKDAAFRVGADVWQAIVDCYSTFFQSNNGVLADSSSLVSFSYTFANADTIKTFFDENVVTYVSLGTAAVFVSYSEPVLSLSYAGNIADGYKTDSGDVSDWFSGWGKPAAFGLDFDYVKSWGNFNSCLIHADGTHFARINSCSLSWGGTLNVGLGVQLPKSSDLVYPSDDYLVKVPDIPATDSVTGALAWPSDAIYTKDAIAVPYPVDSEGVKVPDIPYDKALDKSTGKTLDDTDTGTDTKPGEDTDTGASTAGLIGSIIELLKNFFDSPSDFKLNFDGFKNLILPDRFPFCIPFDMVKAVKLFAVAAADFVFKIDLDTQFFSVHHTVDLTPYAVPIAFFRYACVFWFAWILLSRTRDLMKW